MELLDLPYELLCMVLPMATDVHPAPASVLCVNTLFLSICAPVLYSRLVFASTVQLRRFSEHQATHYILKAPRSITYDFGRGVPDIQTFEYFENAMLRLAAAVGCLPGVSAMGVDAVSFRGHYFTRARHVALESALKLINPRTFSWTGPDPEHHFSTAIVPAASICIFSAMLGWSNLEHLHLTNIAFSGEGSLGLETPFLPCLPGRLLRLRKVYIGQAVFLPPEVVCRSLASPMGLPALEELKLVDVYQGSIWGPRLRRSDIEHAASTMIQSEPGDGQPERFSTDALVARIRATIKCEAKTERIMGGDRVEGVATLD